VARLKPRNIGDCPLNTNDQIKLEAERRAILAGKSADYADYIIEVMREGWMPPPTVNPDLIAVREIVAREWESKMFPHHADAARKGRYDAEVSVRAALAAYKAGASRSVASDLLASGGKQTAILRAAQEILTRYLVPDGLDESQALCALLALLDGPEQRSAQSSWDAAIAKENEAQS